MAHIKIELDADYHVVKPGDTLWEIAKSHLEEGAQKVDDDKEPDKKYGDLAGKTEFLPATIRNEANRLASLNGVKNPNVIRPGQMIFFR